MLNSKIIKKLIKEITNTVPGDWILFGGTVLYTLGIDTRATFDVDIASFQLSTNEDTLKLMTIAEKLKLPIETINQAGAFFLSNIKGWQTQTVLIKKGKMGSVFRPNLELYINLKTNRLSDTDLQDCLNYIKWHQKEKSAFSSSQIKNILSSKKIKLSEQALIRLQILSQQF